MADQSQSQQRILTFIRDIRGAIFAQRSTILISLFAAGALAFPSVTREIYRILADDAYHLAHDPSLTNLVQNTPQVGFAFITLLTASAVIWYVGRDLAWQLHREAVDAGGPRGFLLRWLPVACAMLLPLAAAWGIHQAEQDTVAMSTLAHSVSLPVSKGFPSLMSATQPRLDELLASMGTVSGILRYGVYVCLFLSVVLFGCLAWFDRRRRTPFASSTRYFLLMMAAGIVVIFSLFQIGPPRLLGSIALFNIFVIVLALFVGRGIYINDRFGIPVLLLVFVAALAFSVFDLNDNHVVSQVENKNTRGRQGAADDFKVWLESRADRAAYQAQPYPVFIVSAAGGGLYAAEYTAKFLARIQDHCPHFAQHIFAISGVSGGSVGAAVFASLVSAKVQPTPTPRCGAFDSKSGPLEEHVDAILGKDYLSPIVAATLFPDFLQRLLPYPFQRFDRGKVLDDALEAAWRERFRSQEIPNPLELPMTDLWDPKGVTPALVINATHVATGGRFAMAPFYPQRRNQIGIKLEWLQGHLQVSNNYKGDAPATGHEDLKLSTAAGISARFAWIMPAATVKAPRQNENRKNTTLRLVDGGYFENSGADTAADLIRAIVDPVQKDPSYKVYALVLTGYDDSIFGGDFNDDMPLGEFIAPIRGLLSTRQARGDLTIVRTLDYLCPDLDECNMDPPDQNDRGWHNRAKWIYATLNLKDAQLPLSWHLSGSSRKFIGLHAGIPSDCGNAFHGLVPVWSGLPENRNLYNPTAPPRILAGLNNTNCAASIICGQLANKKLSFSPTGNMSTGIMEDYCSSWDTSAPALTPRN